MAAPAPLGNPWHHGPPATTRDPMAKGPAHLGTSGPHPCDGVINRQVDQRACSAGQRIGEQDPPAGWLPVVPGDSAPRVAPHGDRGAGGFRSIGAVAEDLRR